MSLFDRFASSASTFVARAPFFAACVLMVVVWAPSYFLFGSIDTWQLVINTLTTIITFLLVALLQNSDERFERATNAKLDAQSRVLAELADVIYKQQPDLQPDLWQAVTALQATIHAEDRTSA